jgi:hypothetical protein
LLWLSLLLWLRSRGRINGFRGTTVGASAIDRAALARSVALGPVTVVLGVHIQDPVIVLSVLKKILRSDPVPRRLGIPGQRQIFFKDLSSRPTDPPFGTV